MITVSISLDVFTLMYLTIVLPLIIVMNLIVKPTKDV